MKVDIGFWDINGNYIPDIQEIGAKEMDKNFNEFFDELNDMANFKNFGEREEEEITNADGSRNWEANILFDNVKRLEQENAELKAENERLKKEITELEEKFLTLNGKSYSYYLTLQEIKEIAEFHITEADSEDVQNDMKQILDLITKAESEG